MLSPLHKAVILHVILTVLFIYLEPGYFFNKDGSGPKTFGTGESSTPFCFHVVVTFVSAISFLLWTTFPQAL